MKNALLVLSGGMDGVTLLYDRADEIALAVSFDYGSNHNDREIPFAKLHCGKFAFRISPFRSSSCTIISSRRFCRGRMRFPKVLMPMKI